MPVPPYPPLVRAKAGRGVPGSGHTLTPPFTAGSMPTACSHPRGPGAPAFKVGFCFDSPARFGSCCLSGARSAPRLPRLPTTVPRFVSQRRVLCLCEARACNPPGGLSRAYPHCCPRWAQVGVASGRCPNVRLRAAPLCHAPRGPPRGSAGRTRIAAPIWALVWVASGRRPGVRPPGTLGPAVYLTARSVARCPCPSLRHQPRPPP